jgi:hypothetical protein
MYTVVINPETDKLMFFRETEMEAVEELIQRKIHPDEVLIYEATDDGLYALQENKPWRVEEKVVWGWDEQPDGPPVSDYQWRRMKVG